MWLGVCGLDIYISIYIYAYIHIYTYIHTYIYSQKPKAKSSYALAIIVNVKHSEHMVNASYVEFKNHEKPWSYGRQCLQKLIRKWMSNLFPSCLYSPKPKAKMLN